jgi:hypothetical protein
MHEEELLPRQTSFWWQQQGGHDDVFGLVACIATSHGIKHV